MRLTTIFVFSLLLISLSPVKKDQIVIITSRNCSARTKFGAEKLEKYLKSAGYEVTQTNKPNVPEKGTTIVVGELRDRFITDISSGKGITFIPIQKKEGFSIKTSKNLIIICGTDASGSLYGCLELIDKVKKLGKLPENVDLYDSPEMVMRGTCIGLQKTTYLPGRNVYEYPYAPENFPWFYDKTLWIQYLDMLVENRYNALYLWNGHPFASLVRLKDYPYAVEVDDKTFKKNEEIFNFLTEEANKRGIWVIQMFYNIIVSKPFAEQNNLKTQDRNRPILPIIADYTRKSIAAFIEKYPNVGLLVCLGEAMNTEEDDLKWFTETIIPGVKDGLKALGRRDEPPIILRHHDTNAPMIMKYALPLYKNLYTMHKYNGESLTTYEPRGPWSEIHKQLSQLGSVHIDNVHIMANLEPFRYGSPDFIQKSIQAMHNIHGANGLHLYPQASYWDWPYTADNTTPRLLQINRDWIWYQTWARYAWNCKRDRSQEISFYKQLFGNYYDCGEFGGYIQDAYEQSGEIAPKLLRRFGITDGNRETLTLGLFMSQLVNPKKWRIYPSFYESNGPKGEILIEYAEKEWKKEPHVGETPPQIISEVVQHGKMAVEAIEKAAPNIKKNNNEFARLKNDMYCYRALAEFFSEKVNASMLVLQYKYSKDINDLEKALPYLERSVEHYKKLVELTKNSYLYANSMQTQQRRIPIDGDNGSNKTWAELLPHYNDELANFKKNIQLLKSSGEATTLKTIKPYDPALVKLMDENLKFFTLNKDQKVYSDTNYVIRDVAPELKNLMGIKFSVRLQIKEGTAVRFINNRPVKLLVGYFNGQSRNILPPPSLETNANANDCGQSDIKIANAMDISGAFPVNIYSYSFPSGENVLELGKGAVLVLGFVSDHQEIFVRDAGLGTSDENAGIDWLFY